MCSSSRSGSKDSSRAARWSKAASSSGTKTSESREKAMPGVRAASAALRVAMEAGAEVVSVTPHRVSLESIFLSAVEAGAAEEKNS